MALNMLEVISIKSRSLLQEIDNMLDDLEPMTEHLLQRGYPLTKQLEKLRESRSWNIKMMADFQVPKMPKT